MRVRRYRVAVLASGLALGMLAPVASSFGGQDGAEPIRVQCRGAEAGGFVTPEVGDSLRDLIGAFEGKKDVVRLVDAADQADIVVIVQGRGYQETGRRVYRSTRTRHSYRSTSSKETVKVLRASLQAGNYRLTLYGVDNAFWKTAAKSLAGQVEKWIKGNRPQILAKRQNKDTSFSAADTDSDDEQ
jgi:hypothetical protein